jgi:hypothetical protein
MDDGAGRKRGLANALNHGPDQTALPPGIFQAGCLLERRNVVCGEL